MSGIAAGPPPGRLAGRTALVTGAGSGIGRAVANRYLAEGARVVFADLDEQAAAEAAAGCPDSGQALGRGMDVSREEEVARTFNELSADGWQPDVVVANAGIQLFGKDAPVADLDLATWRATIEVNLTGTFLTLKHGCRSMRGAGGGSMIVTGSPTGLLGLGRGFTAYSASKAGVTGLVRVAAADHAADRIRVNCVVPGFTRTPLVRTILEDEDGVQRRLARVPLGRPAEPADLEGAYVFLASPESAFCTGIVLPVDGGLTAT